MSKPSPHNRFSSSPRASLLSTSVPVNSSYRTFRNTQEPSLSHSVVDPVFGNEDVVSSSSSSLESSSVKLRGREASTLNYVSHSTSEDDEWCHVIHPEDANKRKDHQTTELQTLIHIVKGNVGTGLLALPLAISNAGLAVGGVSLLLLGIIATHCMLMLVSVAHKLTERHSTYKTLNYAQTAEVAISEYTHRVWVVKLTGWVVNIFLIITQFGFCCVYFVFIAEHLNKVFCSAFGVTLGSSDIDAVRIWIAIILIPIIVFCWIRNLESLAPFSMIANVCIAISLAVLFYEEVFSFTSTDPDSQAAAIRPKDVNDSRGHGGGIHYIPMGFANLALFFGNAIYAFEGIGMVLPLENKMKRSKNFKKVTLIGMFIVISLYIFVGTLGYAVFGESAQSSVILNLDESYERIGASIFFLIAKLYFAYAIFASFMLQFYVPMDFLEPPLNRLIDKLKEHCNLVNRFQHHNIVNTILLLVFRTGIILLIAVLAMLLPDLNDLIALIGAIASSALALIFPPLLHLLVFLKRNQTHQLQCVGEREVERQEDQDVERKEEEVVMEQRKEVASGLVAKIKKPAWVIKDVLIMVLGIVGLLLGTYASIKGLVNFFEKKGSDDGVCVNLYPH